MASDCKATPTTTTTLLNSSVYFLWRGELHKDVLSTLSYCDTQPKNHCIQLLNSPFLKFRLDRLVGWLVVKNVQELNCALHTCKETIVLLE